MSSISQGLRHIYTGVNGPTESISAFIDMILRKHISHCTHVIENSTQVINEIEHTPLKSTALDVKSLYMRIS